MTVKAVMIKITLVAYAKWLKELKTFFILFVAHNSFEDVWRKFSVPSFNLEVYDFIFSVKSYRFSPSSIIYGLFTDTYHCSLLLIMSLFYG
jgi:hypothetical protein